MLGALFNNWKRRIFAAGQRDRQVLSNEQFHREIARERIRATRRSIPFCILTLELEGTHRHRQHLSALIRLVLQNVRFTDHKGMLGPHKLGVILVDTPEMGGRAALDRITHLVQQQGLQARIDLRTHDPDGFASDDDDDSDPISDRRRQLASSQGGMRGHAGGVEISADDPLVPRSFLQMAAKRLLDIVGASVGLVITSPLMIIGMVAIRLGGSGPVLFKQTREGYCGRPFTIYKLRTMVVDAEDTQSELHQQNRRDGPAFKIPQDPRVTPVGEFLRKTCIDELPQFWNVLKGEMSLVGPRPLPWHESRACQGWHRRRLEVRPGMTCDWQVNKSSVKTFDDWMRLDLRYVDNIGLFRDLQLIAQTLTVSITGKGGE